MIKVSGWISATPSLLEGIQLINGVEEKKFPLVLNRIAQNIQISDEELSPFTDEEKDKLLSTLNGIENKEDLGKIIDTSAYIFLQAAHSVTKPAVFQNDLTDLLKMSDSKAEMFFNVWSSYAKGIVDKLRQKSIYNPQLDGVSWMLNISAASSSDSESVQPRAIVELKLRQDDEFADNLVMDFDHNQLYKLYETLEKIQSELDNLK